MKTKALVVAFFVSLFSIVSLAAPPPNMTEAQKNDAQALQALSVYDTNQIEAAKVALHNTSNPTVRTLAKTVIKDHAGNRLAVRIMAHKLKLTPLASDQSNSLQQKGNEELTKLKTLHNKDFDTEYMQATVSEHEEALTLLDNLKAQASSDQLKTFLQNTRDAVAHHLEMAKQVQQGLSH